jgi:hypothetical protein
MSDERGAVGDIRQLAHVTSHRGAKMGLPTAERGDFMNQYSELDSRVFDQLERLHAFFYVCERICWYSFLAFFAYWYWMCG